MPRLSLCRRGETRLQQQLRNLADSVVVVVRYISGVSDELQVFSSDAPAKWQANKCGGSWFPAMGGLFR
jgi:hypothetical protein